VTITGTNFTGATKVLFGAVAATSFSVVSSTSITAVSPAQAAAAHNVYVTTRTGTSAPMAADEFTYSATLTVTSISPTSGPVAGDTTLTINGTNFTRARETAARLNTISGLSFSAIGSPMSAMTNSTLGSFIRGSSRSTEVIFPIPSFDNSPTSLVPMNPEPPNTIADSAWIDIVVITFGSERGKGPRFSGHIERSSSTGGK